MRSAIGIFGLVCGAVVIWTVASYGYSTADDPATRWNIAFLYAVIATAGLFGHAVAVRVWRVSGFWSIAIGLTCATALLINVMPRSTQRQPRRLARSPTTRPN